MAHDHTTSAELTKLRSELAAVEVKYGLTVTSVFPGTNPDATEEEKLREVTASLRRIGEELRRGTLEVVELDD